MSIGVAGDILEGIAADGSVRCPVCGMEVGTDAARGQRALMRRLQALSAPLFQAHDEFTSWVCPDAPLVWRGACATGALCDRRRRGLGVRFFGAGVLRRHADPEGDDLPFDTDIRRECVQLRNGKSSLPPERIEQWFRFQLAMTHVPEEVSLLWRLHPPWRVELRIFGGVRLWVPPAKFS